jgi:hypothetical protein
MLKYIRKDFVIYIFVTNVILALNLYFHKFLENVQKRWRFLYCEFIPYVYHECFSVRIDEHFQSKWEDLNELYDDIDGIVRFLNNLAYIYPKSTNKMMNKCICIKMNILKNLEKLKKGIDSNISD